MQQRIRTVDARKATAYFHHLEVLEPSDRDLAQRFLEWKETENAGPARLKKYAIQFKILQKFLRTPFLQATVADLDRFALELRRSNYALETQSDLVKHLRAIYKLAFGNRRTFPELVANLLPPKVKHAKLSPNALISYEDAQVLILATPNLCEKALLSALWATGARASELVEMRREDAYFEDGNLRLRLNGKTGERVFPVFETRAVSNVKAWLEAHPSSTGTSPLWFNQHGRPLKYAAFRGRLETLVQETGFPKKWNAHWWRNSALYHLSKSLSQAQLCYLFGWSQGTRMIDRYLHPGVELVEDDLKKKYGVFEKELEKKVDKRFAEATETLLERLLEKNKLVDVLKENGLLDEFLSIAKDSDQLDVTSNQVPHEFSVSGQAPDGTRPKRTKLREPHGRGAHGNNQR